MKRSLIAMLIAVSLVAFVTHATDWKPAAGPLMTKSARDVKPSKVLPEHPRPQMVREDWQNLNGLWDYAITAKDAPTPTQWAGKILVPFPIQSAHSGLMTYDRAMVKMDAKAVAEANKAVWNPVSR